jgi:hypothetical protein
MTKEIAKRLSPIFKHDFKRARYQQACMHNLFANPNVRKNNISRFDRKTILFDITKQLYIECLSIIKS